MLLAFSEERHQNLSYAKVNSGKSKLLVRQIDDKGPDGEVLYKASLSKALGPNQARKLTVILGFMGILVPYPQYVKQNDPHLVKYNGCLYVTSPYLVKKQTTTIKLSTPNVISSTKAKPHSHKGDKITYGPYTNIKAYTHKALSLHFESKAEFSTVTEMEREIKVCHWGGVVFTETYNLRNSGAYLKDVFSRIEYERMQRGSSFDFLTAKLPANSYGIDYRDDIGNISTSNVRETSKGVVMEMRPRFPLFGGWHTVFKLFYTVPIMQLVKSIVGSSSYILNTTFSTPFEGLIVEDATIKIVLPEGSSNIKWVTPFAIDSVDTEVQKTYLDLTGRPVLVLKAKNLMRYHNQYFQVWYSYPSIMIHRGPLFVVIGFATFFACVIIASRLDLTIGSSTKDKTE
eukprot:CAMPEP_0170178728 /NCGR_PEP_ID=MMETSP0040_2-20121228/13550_1 /TAXON_ID=641309 /ORGANISM="Lotharella oceanica, Strain CCMP622" /LENGTH=399 /DNA_ID=CAMNT_0010422143 /DNA_START=81 /DNA_END=1280 /DNA_ORIENTATION=+